MKNNVLKNIPNLTKCAEHGLWTSTPTPRAAQKPLDINAIDAVENQWIISSGKMSFATVG